MRGLCQILSEKSEILLEYLKLLSEYCILMPGVKGKSAVQTGEKFLGKRELGW